MEEILKKMREIEELKYAEEEIGKVSNLIYNKKREIKEQKDKKLFTLVKSSERKEIEHTIEIKEQEKEKLQEQLDLLIQTNRADCKEKFKIKKEELIKMIKDKRNLLKDNTEELDYLLLRMGSMSYEKLQSISKDQFKQKYENEENPKLSYLKIDNKENQIENNALNKLQDNNEKTLDIISEYEIGE